MTAPTDAQVRDWLPVGQEPHPVGSITHLLVLRSDENSLVCTSSGNVDATTEPATGLYHHDTRHLSRLSISFAGVEPVLLDAQETEHGISAIFCNPTVEDSAGQVIPAQSLTMRRRRVLVERLVESVSVSNYGLQPVDAEVRIDFDADFHDIFEVRGYERRGSRGQVAVEPGPSQMRFRYPGADGKERTTTVRFRPQPDSLVDNRATFRFSLAPRQTAAIDLEVSVGAGKGERSLADASELVRQRQRAWLEGMTRVDSDDERFDALIRRSLLDVEALQGTHEDIEFTAAGVPWFDTLFGRDSLITGIELLAFKPRILGSALRLLAKYQATETDPARAEEPGKIPHELRWGELAGAGEVPFARYYGSVDATPLFILATNEYLRWTDDVALVRELWPNLEAALQWCTASPSVDSHGFLRYARETAAGLENQGWKDSQDALVWPDGSLIAPPIALVEVQAYLVAALRAFAELATRVGRPAAGASARASDIAARFERLFRHKDLGYVFALDGADRPAPTPVSNSGHVLWARSATSAGARRVAHTLLSHDLFSGWGVRTLGSSTSGFNPLSYHRGSVWPHDNALAVAGLRAYELDQQAAELADALFEAAITFPAYRVPELFSGDAREYRAVPTPYPVASRPQAWSAAALPYVLVSMLGIHPAGPGRLAIVRPVLPRGIDELRLANLSLGSGGVDLAFRRGKTGVSVEVADLRGPVEVSLARSL